MSDIVSLPEEESDMVSLPEEEVGSDQTMIMNGAPGHAAAPGSPEVSLRGGSESDVDLPGGICSEDDAALDGLESEDDLNAFDDAVSLPPSELSDMDQSLQEIVTARVPSPEIAKSMRCTLSARHTFAEYWSPPRVSEVLQLGVLSSLSLDLITGWDFEVPEIATLTLLLLTQLHIWFLMTSPPCTAFSALQRLWNYKKISKEKVERIWSNGMFHLEHAMKCCRVQHAEGQLFGFEHPATASSWKEACVKEVRALPGVATVVFDQCMCGLVSPVSRRPMRKRTRIMSNCPELIAAFSGLRCDGSHSHCTVQGSEGGVRLSTFAQHYPRAMCELIAKAARQSVAR